MRRTVWVISLSVAALAGVGCDRAPLSSPVAPTAAADALSAKPGSSQAVTALFRCPGDCSAGDAIQGDGGSTYVASLSSNGIFILDRAHLNGRFLRLLFGPVTGCSGCLRDFESVDAYLAELQARPIDPATGLPAEGGFNSVPVGATWDANGKVNFELQQNGVAVLYTVRFNPIEYPGSSRASVTRTGTSSWSLEATSSQPAGLISKVVRKRGETQEGLYAMPFQITVTRN